jgi:hypothetical protein
MEEVDPNAEATAGDVAGAVLAAAKKTIISQVVKKNVIENIIPIVIALKVSKLLQKSTFPEKVTVNIGFPSGPGFRYGNFFIPRVEKTSKN